MASGRSYIGLATSAHDSALAIVSSNGQVVFAEATERPMQLKRAFNLVPDLVQRTSQRIQEFCEPDAPIVAAFSWQQQDTEANRNLIRNLTASVRGNHDAATPSVYGTWVASLFSLRSHVRMGELAGQALESELLRLPSWRAYRVERRRYQHHLTHAAAACFTSPFENAVCAILDNYGEKGAYAFYHYTNGELREIVSPLRASGVRTGSLGEFYDQVCELCGFDHQAGEEWKVMGLAAYGRHDESVYQLLRGMLVVDGLDLRRPDLYQQFAAQRKLEQLRRKRGQPALAMADVAFTGQKVFTEILYELLRNLRTLGLSRNLVLGGGCALNSSANGGVLEHTGFEDCYVFSAPGDDGNAVGAALLAYREDHPQAAVRRPWQSPYLGSTMSRETLQSVRRFGCIPGLSVCKDDAPERAAQLLAHGGIIGWIQGRAEFGPRALGNRSILADPRSPDVKERINARVKFREEFRPFAPSILHQFGAEYFEHYHESPYMERTLRLKPAVRHKVPGVVHEDGTGRLQTVKKEWNEPFYRLIYRFYELTGVPLVLNTSFNVMGKPIAHSVEDVLAVFYTSGLDAVFIEDTLIQKVPAAAPQPRATAYAT